MNLMANKRHASAPRDPGKSPASRDYIEMLARIHRHLLPRTYAEIGVQRGTSLALSLPGTRAVGVDPEPAITARLPRSATIVPLTSDDFFQRYTATDFFGDTPLDLGFIDGMHLFEFTLRDFINMEKWCAEDSVIIVHDCYPIDEGSTARVRTTSAWTGDVWKLVPCLREFRPNLKVSTIDVPPSGLCIITGLDPTSRVLESQYGEICQRYINLEYSVVAEQTVEVLNAVENDWTVVTRLLPAARFRSGHLAPLALLRSLRLPSPTALARAIKGRRPASSGDGFGGPVST